MTEKVQAEPVSFLSTGKIFQVWKKTKALGAFPLVPAAHTGDDTGYVAA